MDDPHGGCVFVFLSKKLCFRGGSHCALLEFVRDDSPEQFARDAATLIDLLEQGGYRG